MGKKERLDRHIRRIRRGQVMNGLEGFDNDAVFLEAIYEICFGDNAINRGFTRTDVIDQLKELSDNYSENHHE